jgi:hypothetical protein
MPLSSSCENLYFSDAASPWRQYKTSRREVPPRFTGMDSSAHPAVVASQPPPHLGSLLPHLEQRIRYVKALYGLKMAAQ